MKLYRGAVGANGLDYCAAVVGDGPRRPLCCIVSVGTGRAVRGLDRARPKLGRVGIETEDELTLSFLNERSETVAERLGPEWPGPVGLRLILDQPPLTVALSFAPGENLGTLLAAI